MTTYFKAMAGAVSMAGGNVKLLSRGDVLPEGLAEGEADRLKAQGATCTEAEWHAGESTPHHQRRPHRSSVDPRDERETNIQPVVEDLAPPAATLDPAVVGTEDEIIERTRSMAPVARTTEGGLAALEVEDEGGSSLPNLHDLDDDALLGLYADKPPLVKDLVAAVGDDADLAQRVLDAENASINGGARETLEKKLTKVIEGE